MSKFKTLLAMLAIGLVMLPQAGWSKSSDQLASTGASESEQKARNFFTDLEVINQDGEKLRFYTDVIKGKVVLISFIFTACQDACPIVAQKLIQTRALMVDSIKDDVWFVSISVDSANDTAEDMKEFARQQGADESRWLFLTGDKKNLDTIIYKLGQFTEDINAHSTMMLAGNAITRHWTRVLPMTPPSGIALQMRNLVEESPR